MGVMLKAENVAIRYITGDFKDIGLKEYTMRRLTGNYQVKEFMAVDGVSFELNEGDMLGIVGANGAGKSTLLKAVAGIMEPTRGKITSHGDIAALLELGSGFDGDLTVKENAYLRGAMLGYTKEFMDSTYEQIIDFAELREFENRPFKQLSSGMKSRLAFSIASLVKPDILILDEVLSVGDGAFQEKSAKKMREIISQGATTILVSHSLEQIRELCNKVLWLDHGRQVAFGDSAEICDRYEAFLRGECPAEMSGVEEEKREAVAVVTDDLPITEVADKKRKLFSSKRIIVSFVLSLFCAALAFNLGQQYFVGQQASRVEIRAQEGSGEVTFRGAFVDEVWVSPWDHVIDDGGWVYDGEQAVYTAADNGTLVFNLPAGEDRKLIFNAGPYAGVAFVDIDREHFEFNLWNESLVELGLSYGVLPLSVQDISKQAYMLVSVVFVLVFVTVFLLFRENEDGHKGREMWLDALKVVSAIMVVMIHCSGSLYNNSFGLNDSLWLQGLWANAIPRFAVPCFLMVTGALALDKEYGLSKTFKKVIRILIPLIFWSLAYVVSANILWGQSILNGLLGIPFKPQDGSLWYAYQLIWLYLGMPFWSLLWHKLTTKMRWFFVIFSLLIPGLFTCVNELLVLAYDEYLPFASINPVICYVGMLFLGRLLYELVQKIVTKKLAIYGLSSSVIGLVLMILSSSYVSGEMQQSTHIFFSEVRIPGVLYGIGMFLLFGSLRNIFGRMSSFAKGMLNSLSTVSLGVYMSHCLIVYRLLPETIYLMGVSFNKEANFLQLVICVFIYYIVSALMCLFLSRIPLLRGFVL